VLYNSAAIESVEIGKLIYTEILAYFLPSWTKRMVLLCTAFDNTYLKGRFLFEVAKCPGGSSAWSFGHRMHDIMLLFVRKWREMVC